MSEPTFVNPERISMANKLLKILVVFGFFAIVTDYINDNLVMAFTGVFVTVIAVVVIYFGKRPKFHHIPLVVASGLVFALYVLGVFTQLPVHPGKMAWVSIFPFIYFYLMGLRFGLLLSLLSIALMPAAFIAYRYWTGEEHSTFYDLLQGLGGFGLATVLAYKYEQIRAGQEQLLKYFAENDQLTGLLNRRGFFNLAGIAYLQAKRFKQSFAVIFLDLDNFKQLNDTMGHEAGDNLLKEIALILRSVTRSVDTVARWGGEEFIILLMQSDESGARQAGGKICSAISSHDFSSGRATVSVGIAIHDQSELLDETISRADRAMYQAKREGKNRVEMIGQTAKA
jgi:diguanylate cyclase (GGDEF)-like protein